MLQEKLKIKPMNIQELTLAVDRLTRLKFPEIKYNRVFREIISKHLLSPKISFKEYDKLNEEKICSLIEMIFDYSLEFQNKKCPYLLYKRVVELDCKTFLINEQTKKLMQAKIPYETIIELNQDKKLPQNLEFLRQFSITNLTPEKIRNKFKTKFPIEKLVLAEGITEEILLPKFAKILNYDFDENGIAIIPAGGKNQVAKDYLEFVNRVNVPIIVLLDADAKPVAQTISSKLRSIDKLILIEKGEFEDILPAELIEKAINNKFLNLFKLSDTDLQPHTNRVKNLEEIYRINGLGEFKKAEFAHDIDCVLSLQNKNHVSEEIKSIIEEIKTA